MVLVLVVCADLVLVVCRRRSFSTQAGHCAIPYRHCHPPTSSKRSKPKSRPMPVPVQVPVLAQVLVLALVLAAVALVTMPWTLLESLNLSQ